MARIPYPEPNEVSEAKRAILENPPGRLLNVSKMNMHAPDNMWLALRGYLRSHMFDSTIDPKLKELLILRVAYLCRSDYELFHHISIAENLGVTKAQIEAMRTGEFGDLSPEERALSRFVTEITRDVKPTDATVADFLQHFSAEDFIEIIMLINGYMTTAAIASTTGADIEDEAIKSFDRP